MKTSKILSSLFLAAVTPLLADSYSITVTITSQSPNYPDVIKLGTHQGYFTTDGSCTVCTTLNGGGITSFHVAIETGTSVASPAVVDFNAGFGGSVANAEYSTAGQMLSKDGTTNSITMVDQLIGNIIILEMTPTTLNTPPTACDSSDMVKRGCVSIRPAEGEYASGTYRIDHVANPGPTCTAATSNISNFNGTSINPGSSIWFSSNLKVFGAAGRKVQISFQNQSIQFTSNQPYAVPVPDAVLTFDPSASCSSTTFDTGTQTWRTTVPVGGSDEIFLSGVAFPVPDGFSKVNGNVKWQGTMSTDTSSVTMSWKWGAAVYTNFTAAYTTVAPKAAHTNTCGLNNSDHAGTPEGSLNGVSLKQYVTGGARGGGGSNFTGSWSGTVNVIPVCVN